MGYELGDFSLARHVSGRLAGQGFEIKVPLNEQCLEGQLAAGIRHAFLHAYGQIYSAADPSSSVEIVAWGVNGKRQCEGSMSVHDRSEALQAQQISHAFILVAS